MNQKRRVTIAVAVLLISFPFAFITSGADETAQRNTASNLGLPPVQYPPDNAPTKKKVDLGRKLFFDIRLSLDGTVSCASCHKPDEAFTENDRATPQGVKNRTGPRNAPTLLNAAFYDRLFLDGRETALETQIISPLTNAHEMANPSIGFLLQKIKWLGDYDSLFEDVFGAPPNIDLIGKALADYERTLIAANSRFDRWRFGADPTAISEQEKRGFDIFTGPIAECSSCHQIGEDNALFTDNAFHDIGYGFKRDTEHPVRDAGQEGNTHLGRYNITQDPLDKWRFRTPSLRNIELTAPYMHDGKLQSLEEVIDFYNEGGMPHDGQDIRIKKLDLSPEDRAALVAFLKVLTSPSATATFGQ